MSSIHVIICSECGSEFFHSHTRKLVCSVGCGAVRANRLRRLRYATNPDDAERKKSASKEYREANPEKVREIRRAYLEREGDTIRARSREHYASNSEAMKSYQKRYRQEHPGYVQMFNRRNRAMRRAVPHELYSTELILSLFGTDCHICLEPIDLEAPRTPGASGWERALHLDHVIPISRGGTDLIENIRPAHGLCNLRKKNTIEFPHASS